MVSRIILVVIYVSVFSIHSLAQVTYERLLTAEAEPHNWLSYSGTYKSQRHSLLEEVSKTNVKTLELKWVFQAQSFQSFEASPLV
ncbi:uncharacterized protein METZ01_LOCUS505028, partial [marine metagenome]